MPVRSTPRDNRRDRKSALVSLLLLAGLLVGGAGFFSQHYRIEFEPRGQSRGAGLQAAAVPLSGADRLDPEVILVDGCDVGDEEPVFARTPSRLLPRVQLKAAPRQAQAQPCDDELTADIARTGSSAPRLALLSTLTEFQDGPMLGLPVGMLATPVSDPGGYPGLGLPARPDVPGSAYVPGIGTLGGGGGSLPGGGITSLPAEENSDRPLSAPGTTTVSVPEPGSVALLGIALLGVALARRRAH